MKRSLLDKGHKNMSLVANGISALTVDAIKARAAGCKEPEYLTERRLKALAHYLATPLPTRRDEAWRHVDLSTLDIEAAAVRAQREDLLELGQPSASLNALGVFWGATEKAWQDRPELLQQYWCTEVFPAGSEAPFGAGGKFHSLNQALWDNGFVFHAPKGVDAELPVRACFHTRPGADGVFPHNLIMLEEGASATVIEEYLPSPSCPPLLRGAETNGAPPLHQNISAEDGASSTASPARPLSPLCCPQTEIILERGARLRYILVQALGADTIFIGAQTVHQHAESKLTCASAHLGARLAKVFLTSKLLAPKAQARFSGLYYGTGAQKLHLDTLQHHLAPECSSTLLFRGALDHTARAICQGMVRLEPEAQKTDAYQQNRALLLSGQAHMDAIPGLEILANDVRCSHGATIGQIDPTMLFYLMSRGLARSEAKRMIVDGFFEETILSFGLESVIAPLRQKIAAKMSASSL
jgi:Fe-S cluster assembly protein SufD